MRLEAKHAPWAAAVIVVILAIAAVVAVVVPRGRPPAARPVDLWGQPAGPGGGTAPGQPETPGNATRQTMLVLEQDSEIVGADSKLAEDLGIESPRGTFRVVLPRETPVPVGRVVTFRTAADDQKEIRLHVLRGLSEKVSEDRSLGWVRIYDLPPGPRGSAHVAVMFQVVDRAVRLAAQDPANGRTLPIEPSSEPSGFGRP